MTNKGYVKKKITSALFMLLKEKELNEITIKEICLKAQVGRASFYRNYENIEQVITSYSKDLLQTINTNKVYDGYSHIESLVLTACNHVMKYKTFYLLIHKHKLNYLLLTSIKETFNYKKNNNIYTTSFISYGIHGIISTWIKNGMKDSPENLVLLLRENFNI